MRPIQRGSISAGGIARFFIGNVSGIIVVQATANVVIQMPIPRRKSKYHQQQNQKYAPSAKLLHRCRFFQPHLEKAVANGQPLSKLTPAIDIGSGQSPSPSVSEGPEGEAYLNGHKEDGGFARGSTLAVICSRYAASLRASLNSIGTHTVASPPLDLITTYVSDDDLRRLNWHQQSAFPTDESIAISETISSAIKPFTALNCALNQEIVSAVLTPPSGSSLDH